MSFNDFKGKQFRSLIYSWSRQILSTEEKALVWEYLKSSQGQESLNKPTHHRYVWLKCSGAYNLMLLNPGYY